MVWFVVPCLINIFDLGIFWYYLEHFISGRRTGRLAAVVLVLAEASLEVFVNHMELPYLNLFSFFLMALLFAMQYRCVMTTRIVAVVIYMGVGILVEPTGFLLLHLFQKIMVVGFWKYYFLLFLMEIIRLYIVWVACHVKKDREMRVSKLPKRISASLGSVALLSIISCCLVIGIAGSIEDIYRLILCICIISAMTMVNFFMYTIVWKFNALMEEKREQELYLQEMGYKESYFHDLEEGSRQLRAYKHDIKNRLAALIDLWQIGEREQAVHELQSIYDDFNAEDSCIYSDNPVIHSVLRIKTALAERQGIAVEQNVQIPREFGMKPGEIGILYGNLLDNAIEAAVRCKPDRRFLRLESKYLEGNLMLVLTNSKVSDSTEGLATTKKDKKNHGIGIVSVQKVVEKYSGTFSFVDKGTEFEVSVLLYGIAMKQ